jgi:hypothetical protein
LADHLRQWRAASHLEIEFRRIASRNVLLLFKEIDFIALAATGMAFKKPRVPNLEYRKAGIPIIMEGTPRIFLCVVT